MSDSRQLHRKLLRWYDAEKRDLPWRASRDPYRIWLSEIMLQQTRVEAVLPYFHRFTSNFPTVESLAEAEQDSVLNLWAGLGYYSRARNLQAAAKQVVENFSGKFPEDFDTLRTLKGVGPYTAAAIASMAFGRPHCALDGNLERVFARLLAEREDPKAKGRPAVTALGEELVKLGRAGDVNQAVMDLASRICVPREPRCGECPLQDHCEARRLGIQRELPLKKPKPEKILLKAEAWAVVSGEELLLARRPAGEWLAGMWDLPWRILDEGDVRPSAPFGEELVTCSAPRTITKHKIDFEVRGIRCEKRPVDGEILRLCAEADGFRWIRLDELHGINLPRPSEKALGKILAKLN